LLFHHIFEEDFSRHGKDDQHDGSYPSQILSANGIVICITVTKS